MLKISPIIKNNQIVKLFQKNKTRLIPTSLLTLSLLSPITMNNCTKPIIDIEEDTFEKSDTNYTKDNNSNLEITIDSSKNREYIYYF